MEFRTSNKVLFFVLGWLLFAVWGIALMRLMYPMIYILIPLIAVGVAIFNGVISYRMYKEPVLLSKDKLSFCSGKLWLRKDYPLLGLVSISCTPATITLQFSDSVLNVPIFLLKSKDKAKLYQELEKYTSHPVE